MKRLVKIICACLETDTDPVENKEETNDHNRSNKPHELAISKKKIDVAENPIHSDRHYKAGSHKKGVDEIENDSGPDRKQEEPPANSEDEQQLEGQQRQVCGPMLVDSDPQRPSINYVEFSPDFGKPVSSFSEASKPKRGTEARTKKKRKRRTKHKTQHRG